MCDLNNNMNNNKELNRMRTLEYIPVEPYEGSQEDFEDFSEEYDRITSAQGWYEEEKSITFNIIFKGI